MQVFSHLAPAGTALACLATAYAGAAAAATWRAPARHRSCAAPADAGPKPVSVLKPLCGADPNLYDNLAGLCRQRHPAFQLVFGVRAASDPAIAVVERLRAEFPACDIALVVCPLVHGSNLKVSNLINLLPRARHPWLVVADSDIAADPDYLARVTAPLADPAVGVVTCLYRGRPVGGLWPALGAQFIDDWFAPSARVAHACGSRRFSFGATIALRREVLDAVGGFAALSDRLADDFWLGELTRQRGLRTVLSEVEVSTDVTETHLAALWSHELRWLRTIRSINPSGFAFIFITFTWPMLALAAWLAPQPPVLAVALAGIGARSLLAGSLGAALRAPLRDVLLLAEWVAALFGDQVRWRGQMLSIRDRHAPAAPAGGGAAPGAYPLSPRPAGTDNGEHGASSSVLSVDGK
ncbi:bacteriohopanetetrol glucosamine biosynthesis glycosyltransferase HpnI [Cupriavidus sp. WS]|uniref:bacteriohopanetetrol glucosamine biosynthesis glycosyltransferase HpnI n=1 Tax=Cupriavidus sp. WS TaxID=1312922 RepID=UPI0003742B78|nr:bacteriohopanetetrol glucosamine biosynthesis glycosyltransferase HpnI [Cupriavidus sp. WS]